MEREGSLPHSQEPATTFCLPISSLVSGKADKKRSLQTDTTMKITNKMRYID